MCTATEKITLELFLSHEAK